MLHVTSRVADVRRRYKAKLPLDLFATSPSAPRIWTAPLTVAFEHLAPLDRRIILKFNGDLSFCLHR